MLVGCDAQTPRSWLRSVEKSTAQTGPKPGLSSAVFPPPQTPPPGLYGEAHRGPLETAPRHGQQSQGQPTLCPTVGLCAPEGPKP